MEEITLDTEKETCIDSEVRKETCIESEAKKGICIGAEVKKEVYMDSEVKKEICIDAEMKKEICIDAEMKNTALYKDIQIFPAVGEKPEGQEDRQVLNLGIDIGSTTVKTVIVDPKTSKRLFSRYQRHYARQEDTVRKLLSEIKSIYPEQKFRVAVCGSGGKPVAERLGVSFIQEVVANAAAVCSLYPGVNTAIELGGQDAKVIFFYKDKDTGKTLVSDMRMNGSCAGGTGAFIDEMAALLNVKTEDFESLAEMGTQVFDISGRCGVFAKTDIQPLLMQGVSRSDIALSVFHAIAKQTIGGLSQGLELKAPVIFEGGPLTFNPALRKVFTERLNIREEDGIVPEHPETIVAYGTAISADRFKSNTRTVSSLIDSLSEDTVRSEGCHSRPFFADDKEKKKFEDRHKKQLKSPTDPKTDEDGYVPVWMGIDGGSTTSKIVLMNDDEELIDSFYAANGGDALNVICDGILGLSDKYEKKGTPLKILGVGTTGYGEQMLSAALNADYHVVETVAHAQGCLKFCPDVSFILDIGGQDMKAIWVNDGIITNIMLNEACSSGCGSFLENFAHSLSISVEEIADFAFRSDNPAELGSRCTVFMNSTIIHAQREGRNPDDIMAGLCRSIIENVFTKVVRISDAKELGDHIVVQGGTFRNMAVLRALEEYLGKDVELAPFPGEMGAYGAARLVRREMKESKSKESNFIGLSGVRKFNARTCTGVRCDKCANHCMRTIMIFSSGQTWVTGNRCERGAVVDDIPREISAKELYNSIPQEADKGLGREAASKTTSQTLHINELKQSSNSKLFDEDKSEATKKLADNVYTPEDLFAEREQLLFRFYPCKEVSKKKGKVVGLPRVLEFWDSMPFWSTFFRSLGYDVRFSKKSSQKMYEEGLKYVASDTICFPAKLAHGHIRDLADQKVDRIFMPYVMHMPPEGKDKNSPYVCSVVQGYPLVINSSQKPEENYGIPFDTPVFHWFNERGRKIQILKYAEETLGVTKKEAQLAYQKGQEALLSFRNTLVSEAKNIIEKAEKNNKFVVVLAGRPYHSDSMVSHRISKLFLEQGISVIPADSLPGLNDVDLKNTRIEITNNFHTRMLSSAVIAGKNDVMEYVQLVSFGCGHDAVLSDEILRIFRETSNKAPLILKVDESDASGSLKIRVQSFIETVRIRRKKQGKQFTPRRLPQPSPVKFYPRDKKLRTILIPNISKEVSVLLRAILAKEGFLVKTIDIGSTREIQLGKKYVHNDICFPSQMVIGELIGELKKGGYNQDEVAVGMVKFQCDCRMSHYAGLLRKGLDSAGFDKVPIVTTDMGDSKDQHPGVYILGIPAVLEAVWAFVMLDIISLICRKIRPYEINKGQTQKVYAQCVDKIAAGITDGISAARRSFAECIDDLKDIPYDRTNLKPRALVTGELLVTYHPGSNFDVENYLEKNGMETIFPRITDQLRKDFQASKREIQYYNAGIVPWPQMVTGLFDYVQKSLEDVAVSHPLYEKEAGPADMYKGVRDIIPETLSCGEGWLMAAEIDYYARQGVRSFVILQPFGCLPNHICGRGVVRSLKDRYPGIQVLPLDLDPDTGFANVENRLQMLIMDRV